MAEKKLSKLTIGVIVVFLLSFYGFPASASEFKASVFEQVEDQIKIGKIYVQNSLYRLEQELQGNKFIVIVDQDACLSKVLSISHGQYMEMACDNEASINNDPFQTLRKMVQNCVFEQLSTEKVSGYDCENSSLTFEGNKVGTQWVSEKLNFPVRYINHILRDKILELRDIEEGPVDDTLFVVPPSFVKTDKFAKLADKPE
ncbi:MAG: DUF4412 domain-containing protein [candidate division Zixibacteria bacterium]